MIIRQVFALALSALLLATHVSAQNTPLPAFSARTVQTTPDQPDRFGLITKSGSFMRLEFEQGGEAVIQILRPTEGRTLVLYPATKTYIERIGPPQPEEFADSYTPPCPPDLEDNGLTCTRLGIEVYQSIPVERWHVVAAGSSNQMIILWDPKRKRALRQEMSNGTVVQMTFLEMQMLEGREAEHWVTETPRLGSATMRSEWWYDPELQLVLSETLPDGTRRRMENIIVGPVDQSLFTVPDGWTLIDVPRPETQE